ncbi:MAG: hypothetical protein K6E47_13140 [Lachnospiraceae bacterium]|nr:hypothetical protein [Lachnospiraceae bacterium]
MVGNILTRIGMKMKETELYRALLDLWLGDPAAKNRAAGAIGGAVKNGLIFVNEDGTVTRVR